MKKEFEEEIKETLKIWRWIGYLVFGLLIGPIILMVIFGLGSLAQNIYCFFYPSKCYFRQKEMVEAWKPTEVNIMRDEFEYELRKDGLLPIDEFYEANKTHICKQFRIYNFDSLGQWVECLEWGKYNG